MSDYDAIIVGGGIFGRTIALALFTEGRNVIVFDDKRPDSGSGPSACLMKPSWFSGLGKAVHEPALALLDSLFGVETVEFTVRPSGIKTSSFHIPTKRILCCHGYEEVYGRVTSVREGGISVDVARDGWRDLEHFDAPLIVVAAGVWCKELMKVDGLVGKKGVAFRWDGKPKENLINVWAPYKQLVVFQESDGKVWGGDGAAILEKNWTMKRQLAAQERVLKAAKTPPGMNIQPVTGLRPYVPGAKPCLLEERAPGLWLATGGAKNGTVAAGWCAHEILRRSQ